MKIQKLHLIDGDGFYTEDEIREIPETLEEAKAINYPIKRDRIQVANPEDAIEPQELADAKSRLAALEAIPGDDPVIVFAAQQLKDTIADLEAKFERDKLANAFKIVETFEVPPLQPHQVETELTKSFYKAKWDGKKWKEGLSAGEIKELSRPKSPDWNMLLEALRGTDLFGKAVSTTNTNGFTVFMATLTASHNLQDLEWSIAAIRQGLPQDFTPQECDRINQILTDCGFELQVS